MSKTALITGITGQDGAYLADFLVKKGYKVYGTFRRVSSPNFWRLLHLGIVDQVNLIPADLIDESSLTEAVKVSQPDEVYHLAAQSYVGTSFDQPITSGEFTGLAVTRILESIRQYDSSIKFYQASSSEMFGNVKSYPQNEQTAFMPQSPYAVAKVYGFHVTKIYREGYGMFACNGILFNHESPLRGLEFVSRKITNGVAKIVLGIDKHLYLGNLGSIRDWGYAPEYIECMWKMLQQKEADDYVIATGEPHTVFDFVKQAFSLVDLDWKKFVKTDKKLFRILEVHVLQGDSRKARRKLHWKPKTKFEDLVKIMLNADIERWSRWKKGEVFPWDALSSIDEFSTFKRKMI
ncbi:GDP-D-mannose dehydratase, NAD(P)-binding [Nitrosotalea sinensis]|uniref:GDP-mannose 4,6-dehydratase n=1 Tax=Nitrosotalea sinensis TaxID=1499975 RepID=A0A2H1EEQ7_9ARCH|nr:GDP-mannose 4,6-dehydratase [Candidatus Nitrosotalea sinensis]SHO42860.1 GDP-D-mannose dehydratase, NAD(P)-binding [Candidatus Nitrosotalea sinensis]